jgi:hypothetical protein
MKNGSGVELVSYKMRKLSLCFFVTQHHAMKAYGEVEA